MYIPMLPKVPEEIISAASNGRLVVFLGAGISQIVGIPSWQELSDILINELQSKGCLTFSDAEYLKGLNDPRKTLTICKKILVKEGLPLNLGSKLQHTQEKFDQYGRIFTDLYSFKAVYITTNYDQFLDNEAPGPDKIIISDAELLADKLQHPGNILHIHGSINDETHAVITLGDYFTKYQQGGNTRALLEAAFRQKTVLFVGYGLSEVEILEPMMEAVIGRSNDGEIPEIKHYYLLPTRNEQRELVKHQESYYRDLGIKVIPYNISRNGYPQLVEIIKRWSKKIGSVSGPPGFIEQARLIDEVVT